MIDNPDLPEDKPPVEAVPVVSADMPTPEPAEAEVEPTEAGPADEVEEATGYDTLSAEVQRHYETLAKRFFMFPNSLLRELNELIDLGHVDTASKLQAVVKDRYKGTLKIPGRTAFRAYVIMRRRQKAILDKAKQVLNDTPVDLILKGTEADRVDVKAKSIYQDLTLSVENKKTLLENLIKLCEQRISAIKTLQETDPTASYEQALMSYIREARTVTETLIKMRNELKNEGEREIEVYIATKLASVLRSTVQAYTSVHGQDKLDQFRANLKAKLKDNKLNDVEQVAFPSI